MALPSRNRRNVHIDGVHYHWVKGSHGDNGRGVITVQNANGTGAKLMIDPYGRITDDQVPDGIRFAIAHGWKPDESGPPFYLGFSDRDYQAHYVLRDATDPPYWIEFDASPTRAADGR